MIHVNEHTAMRWGRGGVTLVVVPFTPTIVDLHTREEEIFESGLAAEGGEGTRGILSEFDKTGR